MTAATFFLPQFIFLSSSAHPDGESGKILCRLVTGGTIAYIGAVASVATLVAIATERYYAVVHPYENIGKLTDRKMKVRLANVVRLIVAKKGRKRGMPRCSPSWRLRMPPRSAKKSTGTTYRDETKLRNYDSDVNENLAEKKTPHPFKPFRDYRKSPSYLKEGNLSWSWRKGTALARVQTKMVEFITLPFLFSRKLKILLFHVVVGQGCASKKRTKRVMHLQSRCFAY